MKVNCAKLCLLALVGGAILCGGQTSSSPTKTVVKKPQPQQHAAGAFVCPDAEARLSCKSYEELVKAKDKGLPDVTDDRYVCFRKNADEFFIVAFSPPHFEESWNEKYKKVMIDPYATVDGSGYADSYKDGVEDTSIMPQFFFSGSWRPMGGGLFSSTDMNFQKIEPKDEATSATYINSSQFSVVYKYQNTTKQDIFYKLTIQRSTGRFTESFQTSAEQTPFSQDTGRCVYQKAE